MMDDIFLIIMCAWVGFFFCVIPFLMLAASTSRLFIAWLDTDENLKFLMKDRVEPFPYRKVLGSGIGAVLSFITFFYSIQLGSKMLFAVSITALPILSLYLIRTTGIWSRRHMESVSHLIAEIRYNGEDRSIENNRWRLEHEQWLLILDTLGDSISRKSELLIDESICGKKQPLTPDNKWKLETMGFRIYELGSSQIKLDNFQCLACPL